MGVTLAIVGATATGIWAERRWGGRAGEGARAALVFVLYAVLPFVTFFNLARVELDVDLGGGVAIGWVALGLAVAAVWSLGRFVFHLARPSVGAMICCTLIANTGYLGYPLVVTLLGGESLSEAVVYDIGVSSPALLIAGFATGAAFGTRAGETVAGRVRAFFTRNPPLYAAVAGLLAPDALAPDMLVDISRALVVAILPLGFFAVGTALEEEAEEGRLRVPPPLTAPVGAVIAIRLLLAPALLYVLALPLIDLPGPYLLLAAMPCGINTMIVAHVYGLDLRLTAEAVTWTTAIAVAAALISVVI